MIFRPYECLIRQIKPKEKYKIQLDNQAIEKKNGKKTKTSLGSRQRCCHHWIRPRGATGGRIEAAERAAAAGSPPPTDLPADATDAVVAADTAVGRALPDLDGGEGTVVEMEGRPSRPTWRGRGGGGRPSPPSLPHPTVAALCRRDRRERGRLSSTAGG